MGKAFRGDALCIFIFFDLVVFKCAKKRAYARIWLYLQGLKHVVE